ncbi:MAG: PAS domain S-box protein [Candidatus Acidiferrales bacterium]
MLPDNPTQPEERVSAQWEKLDRQERTLWWIALAGLLLLAGALAFVTRPSWAQLPRQFEWIPVAVVALVILFAAYVWKQSRQIIAIRHFLRTLDEPSASSSRDPQFEKLFDTILRSQNRFRGLIDSLDQALFTLTLNGEFQVANRRCVEIFGVSFQELIGHRFDEFLAEPARAAAEQGLPEFLERKAWSGVLRLRLKKTGEARYFDTFLRALVENGQVTSVSGWARDVTAQHESEIRFTELFEALREGIFFMTPEGQVLDANPALVRMLGYESKQDFQAHTFQELYVDPSQRDALVREIAEKGSAQDRELVLRRKDGSRIHCLASAFAIRDTSGRLVRLQGTLEDVTERLEIRKRLHQEQEFGRRLVASFPDIIVVLDTEGRYTFASSRIQDHLGYTPEEFVGGSLADRPHPQDRAAVLELFQELLSGRVAFGTVEYRTQHKNGTWRILRANASPLSDADGKIIGVVASARDITESKQFEQQLLQKEKLAAMGQMIAGVAHELNNPLTAILGVSDLLHERATDDSMRRQTDLVHQQARRAANIVQSLLAFSRPSALGRSRVQMEEMTRRALQFQEAVLRQKKIEVKFTADSKLPAVEGDPNLLLQMIQNLIVNSHQAISSARDQGEIRIHVSRIDDKIAVTVEDDGPGIPAEIMGSIFDPFFTTKRPGGGAGLGLTISMAVAKEHGGTIEARSSLGNGATFRILLPPTIDAESRPVKPAVTSSPASLRGHSVLVVDDEEGIRELVVEGLSARGMAVESVGSSEEALAVLSTRSFDAILCDFNLPSLSGEALFERLREQPGGSPARFVFMTGDLLDAAALDSFARQGARVVQKPFQLAGLAVLLGEVLEPIGIKAP